MGIVEFLKNSSCEEIEEFCARRFGENLQFFEANYPNLFSALILPYFTRIFGLKKEKKLYTGKKRLRYNIG